MGGTRMARSADVIQFSSKFMVMFLITLFISACARMPTSIQSENINQLDIHTVQQSNNAENGQTVRWGGVITQVINNTDDTWIEVLSMKLSRNGRPIDNRKESQGRFIVKIDQFLDPQIYQEGHSLTVIGVLTDKIDGKIGEFNYSFPVVTGQGHHLWAQKTYRNYPYIMPGYWYYGFHPYWRYGYGYYGYGVRYHHGYYPYYPLFGHLDRRLRPLPSARRSGVYTPRTDAPTAFYNSNRSALDMLATSSIVYRQQNSRSSTRQSTRSNTRSNSSSGNSKPGKSRSSSRTNKSPTSRGVEKLK